MDMTVPAGVASVHISLANTARIISVALENATLIYDNALRGLIGISQHQAASDTFDANFALLGDYFVKNGIVK